MDSNDDDAQDLLSAPARAALKRRVMLRVAADSTDRHLTVQPGPDGWQPFMDGVELKVLNERDDGVLSYLLRLAPGAQIPAHRHPVDEECVVLEGELRIGALKVAAGGYHLGRSGVLHDTLSTEHGAVIFLRGAAPEASHLI